MRTTVEIPDELRARLLDLAAKRGEKGFSRTLKEVIDAGLESLERGERRARIERGLAALGSLSDEAAENMREEIRKLRANGGKSNPNER